MAGAPAKKRHAEDSSKRNHGATSETTGKSGTLKPEKSPKSSSGNSSSSGKATDSAKSPSSHLSSKQGLRAFDGNRDPGEDVPRAAPGTAVAINARNLDLGMGAWATIRGSSFGKHPVRPSPSTLGQPTRVGLNTYNVVSPPTKAVYQCEVLIGNGAEKAALVQKVWKSKELSRQLGSGYIFDGSRLAWSMKPLPNREIRCIVDLDAEEGRPPRQGGKENKHRVVIRQTNTVQFNSLQGYLDGKADFDTNILEAINFLDHLLREWPRSRYTPIKRSFFYQDLTGRFDLGDGIEALKGVYQSMRIVHDKIKGARLSINVDVANGTFWNASPLVDLTTKFVGARDVNDLAQAIRNNGEKHRYSREMKRMRKLRVQTRHRKDHIDEYVIEGFIFVGARDHKIEKDGKPISIYDYFKSQYNITLRLPDLPLVKMTRKGAVLPMELLQVKINQRYPYKLSDRQTQKMITFAVEPPAKRLQAIQNGLQMLDWPKDPVLKSFGMQIENHHSVVDARLLQAPTVKFGQGEARPGTSGRWDLRGKKFLQPNPVPLKSWAVCVASGRRGGKPDKVVIENFVREFIKTYQGHGGRVENKSPALNLAQGDDVAGWVTTTWNAAGNQSQARPQILVFVLPDKDSITYGRIKRSCECRYGVVSQCMQYAQVQKCNGQYMSNVCLKFNAKLGGITCRAVGQKSGGPTGLFDKSTLIIGADVSHAAPGSAAASMAALTVSMDKLATRYAVVCQTNGYRNEMINTETFNNEVKPLVQLWIQNTGGGKLPQRVIYLRDGVSEAQYDHVLQQEVQDLKDMMHQFSPGPKNDLPTQFLAIVAGKRHHVRFFPESGKGDRNGNPLPGTLVETGVTHPFENDFYMCSHAAIKGTARPVHYHVILNELGLKNEDIQTLLYEHSYQYIRATTPVSIHSAVYYAHIAAQRAVPHDPKWTGSNDSSSSTDPKAKQKPQSQGKSGGKPGSSSGAPVDQDKLMPMPPQGNIHLAMWYI